MVTTQNQHNFNLMKVYTMIFRISRSWAEKSCAFSPRDPARAFLEGCGVYGKIKECQTFYGFTHNPQLKMSDIYKFVRQCLTFVFSDNFLKNARGMSRMKHFQLTWVKNAYEIFCHTMSYIFENV